MTTKVRIYLLIGVICYTAFLGWYFYKSQDSSNAHWRPADVYTQTSNIQETGTTTTAPAADQVFQAKVSVPMTSRSKHRITNYKRARRRPARMMASNRRRKSSSVMSSLSKSEVVPVGGGIHLLSKSTFHTFGAWGLMNPSYGRSSRRRVDNQLSQQAVAFPTQIYPWYITPQSAEGAQGMGMEANMTSISSQLMSSHKN